MFRFFRAIAASLFLFFIGSFAFTQQGSVMPDLSYLRSHSHYKVQTDGQYTLLIEHEILINTQRGLQEIRNFPIRFTEKMESIDVLEAYSVSPKGERSEVPSALIRVVQFPGTESSPLFQNRKNKVISHIGLQVGSTVVHRFQRTMHQPLFAGQFYEYRTAYPLAEWKSFEVNLEAPVDFKFNAHANLLSGGRVASADPLLQRWQWQLKDQAATLAAPGYASVESIPHVMLSTFDNHEQIASAYAKLVGNNSPDTPIAPAAQKLANELTQGMTDPKAQAEKLYQWVSQEIRTIPVLVGFGDMKPHSVDEVLSTRTGDSKDVAFLLQNLLAAKAIKSHAALINSRDVYWLPPIASPSTFFNHMLVYLPQFDQYLNPSFGRSMFGVLPQEFYGKPVLILDAALASATRVLPNSSASNNSVRSFAQMSLNSSGQLSGFTRVESQGAWDAFARLMVQGTPRDQHPRLVNLLLAGQGNAGQGELKYSGDKDLSKPFAYDIQFQLSKAIAMTSPSTFKPSSGATHMLNLNALQAYLLKRNPMTPFPLSSGLISEKIQIQLPTEMKDLKIPLAIQVKNGAGEFSSQYAYSGQILTIERTLTIHLREPIASAQELPAIQELAQAIAQDLQKEIAF